VEKKHNRRELFVAKSQKTKKNNPVWNVIENDNGSVLCGFEQLSISIKPTEVSNPNSLAFQHNKSENF